MKTTKVTVLDYDINWKNDFLKIKNELDFPVNVCYIYEVTAEDSRCRKA